MIIIEFMLGLWAFAIAAFVAAVAEAELHLARREDD